MERRRTDAPDDPAPDDLPSLFAEAIHAINDEGLCEAYGWTHRDIYSQPERWLTDIRTVAREKARYRAELMDPNREPEPEMNEDGYRSRYNPAELHQMADGLGMSSDIPPEALAALFG